MSSTVLSSSFDGRAEISIYWIPGCSSCAKVKEFVAEHGVEFESVNVLDHPEAMEEVTAAGLRGVPAIRSGTKFAYAQSLDEVAKFLGVAHKHTLLPRDVLLRRWDEILELAKRIVANFDSDILQRRVIPQRERTIHELGVHTFQVAESFLRQVEDDTIDARAIYLDPRIDIATKNELTSYVEAIHSAYCDGFLRGTTFLAPTHLNTHYGLHPFDQVLERGVWHTAQHARQLDFIAAGMGAELQIPDELYSGLPLPKRLW